MRNLSRIIGGYVVAMALGAAVFASIVAAQQPPIPRIGVICVPPIDALLRNALRDRGYVEGKSISIDWRSRYTNDEELKSAATELVHQGVAVIVTFGTPAARAALSATAAIPVIVTDPINADAAKWLLGMHVLRMSICQA